MSHKGSRSRVSDRKAWDECPLWSKIKLPTSLIDIIKEYPSETLSYEKGFDVDQYDLPLETHFKIIEEIPIEGEAAELALLHAHLNEGDKRLPRIFLITNHNDQTCKMAVWME